MPIDERNHDRAVWIIHTLMNGECRTLNERFKALDDLTKLPFEAVVGVALRDGFSLNELIEFVRASQADAIMTGNVVSMPGQTIPAPWKELLNA